MAYEMTTTYTCDRCGLATTVDGAHEPEGWTTVEIRDHDFNKLGRSDLCPSCTESVVAFVAGDKA